MSLLSGWGKTAHTAANVTFPANGGAVAEAVEQAGSRGVIARGLGRSYGDPAQNAGGTVLDMTRHAGIVAFDGATGVLTALAGTSLDYLMRVLVPSGWFVPVTPGTRHVTVGGAIANDIHGKNHHRDGSFAEAVTSMTVLLPNGSTVTATPHGSHARLFWATIGGIGLTGIVLDATFKCQPILSSRMVVDTERAACLDDCMAKMEAGDISYKYTVAWIDCLATGASLGRSVITSGDHAPVELAGGEPYAFVPPQGIPAPQHVPTGLLNRSTVRAFNEVWYRKAPRLRLGEVQPITKFFHPLDGVRGWNAMYGRRGFIQYQFVVPFGEEDTLRRAVETLAQSGAASFLAVLKRFGPASNGLLSFPAPGWTLALDLPAVPELSAMLDHLDDAVVNVGGRVYLAKDSRMRPELLPAMYPRLQEWRELREALDPNRRLMSDMARRLGL